MEFPAPDDPAASPVWENYVVAQAAQAALRSIPPYAHAVGVHVDRNHVALVIQVPLGVAEADEDIHGIEDALQEFLGPVAAVSTRLEPHPACTLSPNDGVRWFYASRP